MSRHGLQMSVLLARQPIVNSHGQLFGYELLFRKADGRSPADDAGTQATATVLWNTMIEIGVDRFGQGYPLFVNVPDALLGSAALDAVPKNRLVVEVLETTQGGADIRDELLDLQHRGIRVALDDFCEGAQTALLPLVDFVKIQVEDRGALETARRLNQKLKGQRLIADRIETAADVEHCGAMGIDLFQGDHFARPRPIEGPKDRVSTIVRMRLLAALQDDEVSVAEVERVLGQDPELCFRVLRYATSAFAGRSRRVSTIREALVTGGLSRLRSLASALVMSGMASGDLWRPTQSLIRARFCQELADRRGLLTGTGFLVGLFSGLPAVLQATPEELVREIHVSDEVACALVGHEGPFGKLLETSLAFEGSERALDAVSSNLTEARLYLESVRWAEELAAEIGAG